MTLCVAARLPLVISVMVLKPLSLTLVEKSRKCKSVTVFLFLDCLGGIFFFSYEPPLPGAISQSAHRAVSVFVCANV